MALSGMTLSPTTFESSVGKEWKIIYEVVELSSQGNNWNPTP